MLPHTGAPQKLVTLTISMVKNGAWKKSLGGGTNVLRLKDPRKSFNFFNNFLTYDEVEKISVRC